MVSGVKAAIAYSTVLALNANKAKTPGTRLSVNLISLIDKTFIVLTKGSNVKLNFHSIAKHNGTEQKKYLFGWLSANHVYIFIFFFVSVRKKNDFSSQLESERKCSLINQIPDHNCPFHFVFEWKLTLKICIPVLPPKVSNTEDTSDKITSVKGSFKSAIVANGTAISRPPNTNSCQLPL